MTTWNAQGLFAAAPGQLRAKTRYVEHLARSYDATLLTETHSVPGAAEAWRGPRDSRAWWSHGTASRAGVGVIVQGRLLEAFPERDWIEFEPGRAAVLRLGGPQGSLDLVVVYFPTGSARPLHEPAPGQPVQPLTLPRQRAALRLKVARALRPAGNALAVIAGDFNWVVEDADRVSAELRRVTAPRWQARSCRGAPLAADSAPAVLPPRAPPTGADAPQWRYALPAR